MVSSDSHELNFQSIIGCPENIAAKYQEFSLSYSSATTTSSSTSSTTKTKLVLY